jgi:hypothetical protein
MQVDPAGNLNFPNCTASTTGGGGGGVPTVAPTCTNSTITVDADLAVNRTITASCTGVAIDGYGWQPVSAAPFPQAAPTTVSFSAGPFTTAGDTFTYNVAAHNAIGFGASAIVTVNVVAPGVCGANQASATWTGLTVNSGLATVPQNSYYAFKLPLFPTASKSENFNAINAPNPGAVPLPTEFTISTCPGDFTNFLPSCKAYGAPDNSSIGLSARTYPATGATFGCALRVGVQYYLNVRNVDSSNVNACPLGQCSLIVQHHGG